MAAKKKPALTPEAAKILEQYRNAGSKTGVGGSGVANGDEAGSAAAKPAAPPPAAARRSGTRGK